MKTVLKHRLFFLMAFGVSKAIVFLAPLLLSNTLSKTNYGVLEYALNIAFIGAAIINFGVPNAYPYFKLKRKFQAIYTGFNFHFLYLLASSFFALISIFIFRNETQFVLSVLFIYTLSNQVTYSLRYKTDEKIIKAVFVDALFYVVLLCAYFYIYLTDDSSIEPITYGAFLYSIIYMIIALKKGYKLQIKAAFKKHQKLIKYGKSVMLSGLFILLIANSGRIVIDLVFNDKELIAIFGFYFRMASFVVMLHQILNIIYFKRIYTFNTQKLDTIFVVFLSIIALGVAATYFIIPKIGIHFFKLFETFPIYKDVYLVLCFQMIFWIVLANNENVIYREKLASKMNIAFTLLLTFFAVTVTLLKDTFNFNDVVIGLYLLIVTAVTLQFYILYKFKKIKLKKTIVASVLVFLLSLILII
ncbi:hypothetical protein MWU58_03245 [Flavobacteriaceae bacterium S0825]|uniref:hypothetical protein n=1 Tax=Gaetbulibacter sp. S0825 TaxID=2720084 RepID=UPI0014311D33|nr:hypothetical protein [Gaetbulibacter sp. S0825]MCK0108294.1 hypothetical protein [Flavobacteriaceae bacterium S0825]NIX63930.1 hypothetical protein [Gaetbulibacter sp. S0825]